MPPGDRSGQARAARGIARPIFLLEVDAQITFVKDKDGRSRKTDPSSGRRSRGQEGSIAPAGASSREHDLADTFARAVPMSRMIAGPLNANLEE